MIRKENQNKEKDVKERNEFHVNLRQKGKWLLIENRKFKKTWWIQESKGQKKKTVIENKINGSLLFMHLVLVQLQSFHWFSSQFSPPTTWRPSRYRQISPARTGTTEPGTSRTWSTQGWVIQQEILCYSWMIRILQK